MSLFKNRLSVQGGALVKRDAEGEVVERAAPVEGAPVKVNVRAQMRQMTKGGLDQAVTLYNISQGLPWRAELPDGTHTDWIVPTTAERMQAAQWLYEIQNGRAVPQTEVHKAEQAHVELDQLRAMSDADLAKVALPYLERVVKKEEDE